MPRFGNHTYAHYGRCSWWSSRERHSRARAETVALWLFDEQIGLYPSCLLSDANSGNCPCVLGPGGQIVEGKFGNALGAVGAERNSSSPMLPA